ncbi:MAG: response regulator transcription factor [Candidatus Pseudobacter hemicellulosilyticus]|uniref:Response regulator transcription factor n=1 Tax=Candidatus Pseudobacter hemicellulosilyticus TaxID=3121375 RepID=A0AAJ5WX91_9BACT|nr:MAG: response regulator transcription factor [Pseudobacter sp.]
MAIKIGIADDHLLIIKGFESMLQTFTNCELLFTALSGEDLFRQLAAAQPDILLLDIQLPDSSGIDLCKSVSTQYPGIHIMALTNHEETVYVKKMMRNGAKGYLLKSADPQTLQQAIDTLMQGGQYIDARIEKAMLSEAISGKKKGSQVLLTKRETEILGLIAGELTNQEIADKLFISLRTVETHRLNLTQKLNVKNTAGLVKEAYLRNLVQ